MTDVERPVHVLPDEVIEPVDDERTVLSMRTASVQQVPLEERRSPSQLYAAPQKTAVILEQSLNIGALGASLGFAIAKAGTALGFGVARSFLNGLDYATGDLTKGATSAFHLGLNVSEFFAQMGISMGEHVTAVSMTATSKSLAAVKDFYGNGEAVRALAEFVALVKREMNTVAPDDPPGGVARYSLPTLARAMAAWAILTTLTNHLEPFEYTSELTEIPLRTVDVEKDFEGETLFEYTPTDNDEEEGFARAEVTGATRPEVDKDEDSTEIIRQQLRRYASLCLGSYGGLGFVFFGVPIRSTSTADQYAYSRNGGSPVEGEARSFSYWDMMRGLHDREIIERLGALEPGSLAPDVAPELAIGRRAPRHYLVTDHPAKAIAVCVRGTLSMDDVATDLACEEKPFPLQNGWQPWTNENRDHDYVPTFNCHGGMLEVASELGRPEGALVKRITELLRANEGYELHVVGHSLGAGIACLLALLWADPDSALTTSASGLPPGIRVTALCFATPAIVSDDLGRRVAPKLVRSCVVGDDVVPRFSLNHMLDLRSAAAWLCYGDPSHINRIFDAAMKRKGEDLEQQMEEEDFLVGLRKTLEASMHKNSLYPGGKVFMMNRTPNEGGVSGEPRIFEVTGDVARVFKQIRFSSGMLSDHLPHRYARLIADYL